jgi:hypothetical protein
VNWQYKLLTYRVTTEAPDINKDSSTELFCALLFWNYTRDKQISPVLGHTGRRTVPIVWHDFRICVCFGELLCRWGTIRGTCWKITGRH